MKKKSFSIKYRVIIWIFALLFPSLILLGVISIMQVEKTYEQLTTSEETSLHLLVSQLEQETQSVENHLYDLVLEDRVFRSMADQLSDARLYAASYEVLSSEEGLFRTNADLSFLLLYSEANEYYAFRDNGLDYLELEEQVHLREAVEKRFMRFFLERNSQHRQWFVVEIAERNFLCRVVYYQGMYCAGIFDLSPLAKQLSEQLKENCVLVFRDGETLLTPFPSETVPDDWSKTTARLSGNQKYMILNEELCGIELSYLYPYSGIVGIMGIAMFLVLLIAIAVLVAIPIFYLQLKRDFFQPLDGLVDTMRRIRDGSTDTLLDETRTCEEFREVNTTFNQMMDQIRNLKIEQYEKELETQRAELSFLQAQIRPHFYLNCLKVLYALAQQGQYEDIKTCVLLVSKHLRYALRTGSDTVPMSEELSFCENYVKLYGVMSNVEPQLVLDIEPALLDVHIPPISLLSLVENSVRINLAPNTELQIRIRAKRIHAEEGPMLYLMIQDNGSGFAQEQLEKFNGDEWIGESTTHVGLQNVVRRFRILYGDDFSVAFLNRDGATIEFYLPIGRETGEEDSSAEAINC